MNRSVKFKILSSYRMLLRHYYEVGVGFHSKFTGALITHELIDTIQNRYLHIGGKMKDIKEVDKDFSDA